MNKLIVSTAQWCSTCKPYKQVLLELDTSNYEVIFVDVDTASKVQLLDLKIRGVPTTILQDSEGNEVKRSTGAMSLQQIKQWLEGV
jgi:thiol:disulfide interchange protein